MVVMWNLEKDVQTCRGAVSFPWRKLVPVQHGPSRCDVEAYASRVNSTGATCVFAKSNDSKSDETNKWKFGPKLTFSPNETLRRRKVFRLKFGK